MITPKRPKGLIAKYTLPLILLASILVFVAVENSSEEVSTGSTLSSVASSENQGKVVSLEEKKAENRPVALLAGKTVNLEIRRTLEERKKGLSGKLSLGEDDGMLFIFPKADIYKFWMPDMNFAIDIIWIENGVVVGMHENVSNEFDRKNPKFYTVSTPAKYVLEVNAGWSEKYGLEVGDKVEFLNID
jgi:uncharacterized protein